MSFSDNNGNFLKFEFHISLRGLNAAEKALKYESQIKIEARRRFKLYYGTIKFDLPNKIAFYQELLSIFGVLEKRFLLYSIYLDPDCERMIADLGLPVIQQLQLNNDPLMSLFERRLSTHNGSFVKGFLKAYFERILDLSSGEWEEENGVRNPVTNKLIFWLINFLKKDDPAPHEFENFILNYTKLWNIYFTYPYDITKALILTYKLLEQYKQLTPQEIKINIYDPLRNLNHFIGELLPDPYDSPLTDLSEPLTALKDSIVHNQQNLQRYLNKNRELYEELKKNAVFFQDMAGYDWAELFMMACDTSISSRTAYVREIEKRYSLDRVPKFKELIAFFDDLKNTNLAPDRKMLERIIAENYIFFF